MWGDVGRDGDEARGKLLWCERGMAMAMEDGDGDGDAVVRGLGGGWKGTNNCIHVCSYSCNGIFLSEKDGGGWGNHCGCRRGV